jgi:hypothetical protein
MGETQERQLQKDFGELRKWVDGLPPMVDRSYLVFDPCGALYLNLCLRPVSGKVIRTSDHPIASGGSQDIYTGEWTGHQVRIEGDGSRNFRVNFFFSIQLLGGPCVSPESEPCRPGGEMRS